MQWFLHKMTSTFLFSFRFVQIFFVRFPASFLYTKKWPPKQCLANDEFRTKMPSSFAYLLLFFRRVGRHLQGELLVPEAVRFPPSPSSPHLLSLTLSYPSLSCLLPALPPAQAMWCSSRLSNSTQIKLTHIKLFPLHYIFFCHCFFGVIISTDVMICFLSSPLLFCLFFIFVLLFIVLVSFASVVVFFIKIIV